MRVTIARPWKLLALAVVLVGAAGAVAHESAESEARTRWSGVVAEFRLYPGGAGGTQYEIVSDFRGRWIYQLLPASLSYNSAGEPAGLNTMGVLTAAATTWNGVPGHYFRFKPPTTTAVQQPFHPDTGCDEADGIDGVNTIQWSPGWGESTFLAVACLYGGTLVGDPSIRLTQFDIWIRADAPWSTSSDPGSFDLQTVLLHELGHALGLGHDPDATTVMFDTVNPGEQRRTPTAEDAKGVLHLYADNLRRVIPGLARQ